uniref:SHSP domain-containing protein n=1 Tax=Romanomermis culicivorax TaxID=13658 RepID=A0A915LA61_ROMCU
MLPKDVDPATLTSNLNDGAVLCIEAPKKALEQPRERSIPIQRGSDGDKAPKVVKKQMIPKLFHLITNLQIYLMCNFAENWDK